MSHLIIRMNVDGAAQYLVWSTVVDAPLSLGVSRDELVDWWLDAHGESSRASLATQLRDADWDGGMSARSRRNCARLVRGNRAGMHAVELSLDEIREF